MVSKLKQLIVNSYRRIFRKEDVRSLTFEENKKVREEFKRNLYKGLYGESRKQG